MKVLLTGANGNLGTSIMRQPGLEVVPVGRNDWGTLNVLLAAGIDVVVHAAADLRTRVATHPVAVLDSNVMSTARLLEAVSNHKVRRFVLISSCAVYGNSVSSQEETVCTPISTNGVCKLLCEQTVEQFCNANGITFTILRVFNTFGGSDHFSMIHRLQSAAIKGKPFILNNHGVAQRDWIHVDDVAGVVVDVLSKQPTHTHLNVGSGAATRVSDLVQIVQEYVPQLQFEYHQIVEAEYSRANIERLRTITDRKFILAQDFLRAFFAKAKSS